MGGVCEAAHGLGDETGPRVRRRPPVKSRRAYCEALAVNKILLEELYHADAQVYTTADLGEAHRHFAQKQIVCAWKLEARRSCWWRRLHVKLPRQLHVKR